MGRKDTIWGAFHLNLDVEIDRVIKELERIGIEHPTKLEASALIAERSKRLRMSDGDAKDYIKYLRGVY